jgi:DNA-binding protein Fis
MQALEKAGGNQTHAARILRISRDRLRYKVKKHNLQTPDSRQASEAAG